MAHVAGLDQLPDGTDRFLDRDVRIESGGAVDVDVVDPEAGERVGGRGLYRRRARVVAEPGGVRPALGAELDAQQVALARAPADRLGDQQLVVAHAVEVAGVEQIDPGVEGGVDRRDALAAVARPVHPRHPHAAEAERRDLWSGAPEAAGGKRRVSHGSNWTRETARSRHGPRHGSCFRSRSIRSGC